MSRTRLVVFADTVGYESFLMFAAALRGHGVRVQRVTVRPPDKRGDLRNRMQQLVFHRVDPVLDPLERDGGVGVVPLPPEIHDCASLEATEPVARGLLTADQRIGPPKTALGAHESLLYDKLAMTRFAEQIGVPIPCTWNEQPEVPRSEWPLVVKGALGNGGEAVAVVHDDAELAAAWSRLARNGDPVFVQQFVPGPVVSVGGVSRAGDVLAAASYGSRPADRNPLGPPARVRLIDAPAVIASTRSLVGALGYTGMFCLDFVGALSGTPLLVDFNPRIFGSWAALQRAGVDLVAPYLDAHDLADGVGRTRPQRHDASTGARWAATAPYGRYLGKTSEPRPLLHGAREVGDFTRHLGWRWLVTRSTEVAFVRERRTRP